MPRPFLLAAAFVAGLASANPSSPLLGVWIEMNGPGVARIDHCPDNPGRLCAVGLARGADGSHEPTGPVLEGIRPDGANRWRATYLDGGRRFPATLRLTGEHRVEMRVCILVLCERVTFTRRT
jgi:uncharacterized protein (DUF2147 family)